LDQGGQKIGEGAAQTQEKKKTRKNEGEVHFEDTQLKPWKDLPEVERGRFGFACRGRMPRRYLDRGNKKVRPPSDTGRKLKIGNLCYLRKGQNKEFERMDSQPQRRKIIRSGGVISILFLGKAPEIREPEKGRWFRRGGEGFLEKGASRNEGGYSESRR